MFLKHISNFISIRFYLLFNPWTYFLCIILDYKNSKFKHFINDIVIDLWFYLYFASMEDIRRKCNPMIDLSKFTFNNKIYIYIYILNGVITLIYNQVYCQILS